MTLSAAFKAEIEKPQGGVAMVWLVELVLHNGDDGIPPTLFRGVLGRTEETAWPPAAPLGDTFYPFNFTFSVMEETSDGDIPQLELTVDNSARTLMRFLHDGSGLEGNRCTTYMIPESSLGVSSPVRGQDYKRWDYQVASASANFEAVVFRLEWVNFNTVRTPTERFSAFACRRNYGSLECGYVLNAVAGYATCDKTLAACVLRGLDHASRGLPVLHPRRYGGFPGLASQRR